MALSKRFALVPLGPPLLNYSSTAKCMLQYDAVRWTPPPLLPNALFSCPPFPRWLGEVWCGHRLEMMGASMQPAFASRKAAAPGAAGRQAQGRAAGPAGQQLATNEPKNAVISIFWLLQASQEVQLLADRA